MRLSKPPGQLGHAVAGPVAQFGQHVGQIGAQVDVQSAAGFDDGDNGCHFGTELRAAQMQPIFAFMNNYS